MANKTKKKFTWHYSYILFWLLSWQRFASARSPILGLNSLEVATLNVACKCSSVSRDLITDLLAYMDEKNCLHTYVLPNIAIILAVAESSLGNLSQEINE